MSYSYLDIRKHLSVNLLPQSHIDWIRLEVREKIKFMLTARQMVGEAVYLGGLELCFQPRGIKFYK